MLSPRALTFCIPRCLFYNGLKQKLDAVYDITIGYVEHTPGKRTLINFFCTGRAPRQIHMRVKRYEASQLQVGMTTHALSVVLHSSANYHLHHQSDNQSTFVTTVRKRRRGRKMVRESVCGERDHAWTLWWPRQHPGITIDRCRGGFCHSLSARSGGKISSSHPLV